MNIPEHMRQPFMIALLTCLTNSTCVHAAVPDRTPTDSSPTATVAQPGEDAVSDLLRVLDEETELATRTKLNIDFVPGMVTVLHGKDLLAKGVRTVYEALGLIPGVELSMAGDGQYQFLVRGMGKTFASTKIKFLINGIDMNSTLGPVATVRTIPIEQVDRIEMVRGPGSAIYGENALAGVVDVITLERDNDVFARYGDVDGNTLGVSYGYHPQASKFGFSLNIAGTDTDGGDVKTGKDRLWASPLAPSQTAISNAPGASNERERNSSAILNMNYVDLALYLQHVRSAFGDHFGVADVLPDDSATLVRRWDFDTVEVRNPWHIGSAARAEVRAGWTRFVTDASNQQLYPAGFQGKFQIDGVLGGPHYEETRTTVKTSFEFSFAARHYSVAGAEYADVRQGDTWNERNYALTSTGFAEAPQMKYDGSQNWLKENLERRIVSAYLQDQYTGIDKITVTAGLRIDHYDDVGNAVTPRIGAVYQMSSRQTLKLQYSDAFRPPSFLELYSRNNPVVNGNPDIKPERMHNVEAGYAYNSGQHIVRATAFSSEFHDIIVVDSTSRVYQNGGKAHIRGFELEGVAPLQRNVKLDGTVSLQNSDTQNGLSALWGAAQRLANVGVLYQVKTDRFVNVQYRYVGTREREAADTRFALAGYQTFDFTVSADKCGVPELNLRAGIRNVFDADVVYPAPKATYPDDYPRPGRQWWLAANYKI